VLFSAATSDDCDLGRAYRHVTITLRYMPIACLEVLKISLGLSQHADVWDEVRST
jgi:hypothetical protein